MNFKQFGIAYPSDAILKLYEEEVFFEGYRNFFRIQG